MTSTPGLRPITEADVPAVLALNHRFVDLLSPLDAERLLWLVGLADHADVVELDDRVVGFVLTMLRARLTKDRFRLRRRAP